MHGDTADLGPATVTDMTEGETLYFEVNGCRGFVEGWKIDRHLGPAPYTVAVSEDTGVATVCNTAADPICEEYLVCSLDN